MNGIPGITRGHQNIVPAGACGCSLPSVGYAIVDDGSIPIGSCIPCNNGPPLDGILYWFMADKGVTVNGSNQASNWNDQTLHKWDVQPINSIGVLQPTSAWPVLTPGVQNGLPGMLFNDTDGTVMTHVFPVGSKDLPSPDDAPVMILAVVKPHGPRADFGGIITTMRLTANDIEFGFRFYSVFGIPDGSVWEATLQDFETDYIAPPVSYVDTCIQIDQAYYGPGVTPDVFIGGVAQPITGSRNGGVQGYNGNVGFGVGWLPATANGNFNGYICEVMAYLGTDPIKRAAARTYLRNKWAV